MNTVNVVAQYREMRLLNAERCGVSVQGMRWLSGERCSGVVEGNVVTQYREVAQI